MAHQRFHLSIDTDAESTTSPKSKPFCFPSCFTPTGTSSSAFKTLGSPTGRSRLPSPCSSWIADIGGSHLNNNQKKPFLGGGRRRHHSADFRYDAMSYALNFDDGDDKALRPADQGYRCRDFVARLPASPPPPAVGVPPERS